MSAQNPSSSRYSSSGAYYYFEFFVDGVKNTYLMSCLRKFRIENSLTSSYPNITLEFAMDNDVIITQNLYPHKEITMDIYFSNEDNKIVGKPLTMNLVILEMSVPLPQKYMYNISEPMESQKSKHIMLCVPKQALEPMNFMINMLWQKPKTVKQMVLDLIDYVGFKSKEVDERNMNTTVVKQCIIPPMSFRNALRYLDDKFGIYTGKLFFNVNYNGTFVMYDLKKKFDDYKPGGLYTIHKMPTYTRSKSTYIEPAKLATKTDTNHVTYDDMETLIKSNDVYIPQGIKQYHIFHPDWDLCDIAIENADKNAEDYGIHSKDKDLKIDSAVLNKRIWYCNDVMGEETGKGYHTRVVANTLNPAYGENGLHFKLYRKTKPHKLMRIGVPIELKVYSESEKFPGADYSGSWLVTRSILTFSREPPGDPSDGRDTVRIETDITCCRTTQENDSGSKKVKDNKIEDNYNHTKEKIENNNNNSNNNSSKKKYYRHLKIC